MSNAGTPPPEDAKPTAAKVQLKVKFGNDEDFMEFKIKNTTRFQKVFEALASQRGVAIGTFSLDFDGQRINGTDTPADLDMEEEASVDFRVEQVGGRASL